MSFNQSRSYGKILYVPFEDIEIFISDGCCDNFILIHSYSNFEMNSLLEWLLMSQFYVCHKSLIYIKVTNLSYIYGICQSYRCVIHLKYMSQSHICQTWYMSKWHICQTYLIYVKVIQVSYIVIHASYTSLIYVKVIHMSYI